MRTGYTGRETAQGGLWYYRARFYNPFIGRFISEDPIRGLGPGAPPDYAYVLNAPLTFSDPMGLASVSFQRHNTNARVAPNPAALKSICLGQHSCTHFPTWLVDCACSACVDDEYHMEIKVVVSYDMYLSHGGPRGD